MASTPFNLANTQFYYHAGVRYKQAPPYVAPLPYEVTIATSQGNWGDSETGGHTYGRANAFNPTADPAFDRAKVILADKTWAKVKEAISDRAGWGETLAQYGKSVEMIGNRLEQIAGMARAIRQGNLVEAGRKAGINANDARITRLRRKWPDGPTRKKQASQLFLEFHFGWQPAVNDIYSSIDVLQKPIKRHHIRVTAQDKFEGGYNNYTSSATSQVRAREKWRGTVTMKQGFDVAISNPNLFLANQLGLVNPAVVAWQVTPMSFLVDWFVNVESFLSSYSDLMGLATTNEYTTIFTRARLEVNSHSEFWTEPTGSVYYSSWDTAHVEFVNLKRSMGLTQPSLYIRPFKGLSPTRGLTAVALVLSIFGK